MNSTQVQATIVKRNPQIESASSRMALSLFTFIIFAREDNMLKESLFKKRLIIIGNIKIAIEIIPIIPDDFFIKSKLEFTVRKASLTEAPTNGTKLLIAKRAVLIDKESALCESVLLNDKTNINIDITNTVTEEKVVFTVLEMPLKSTLCPTLFIQAKDKHILISGSINAIKNPSTKLINKSIVPLIIIALETLPLIVKRAMIIGMKAFITLHKICKYSHTYVVICKQIEKTAIDMQRVEHKERILLTPVLTEPAQNVLKMLIMIINASIEPKLFKTLSKPENRYETVSSSILISLKLPFKSSLIFHSNASSGIYSNTYSGKAFLKSDISSLIDDVILSVTSSA